MFIAQTRGLLSFDNYRQESIFSALLDHLGVDMIGDKDICPDFSSVPWLLKFTRVLAGRPFTAVGNVHIKFYLVNEFTKK
jgi:hypothetical protein